MAIKRQSQKPEVRQKVELLISVSEAKEKLLQRIERGKGLKSTRVSNALELDSARNDYDKWNSFNSELLSRVFSTDELSEEYDSWVGIMIGGNSPPPLSEKIAELYSDIDDKIHRLDSIIERLEIIPVQQKLTETHSFTTKAATTKHVNNKVFVVHGHNENAKNNLDIFLRENGLEPIVLHRQADEGLTIIEKFEKHSEVGYAFILLTPDEIAYLKNEENKPDGERNKEYRARPNVIFEFGYFIGKLGRARVCCLHTGNVSLPSDVNGMIYKGFNNNNIEEAGYSILKDLRAAGYDV